ncbi:MAG: type II toxin-antitoxin system RelE/ParE family toxin [Flavobacteriaceae bacterium]|nr:type II toxin-antitoxin system RelE/ParE family toxin [Flavobacteriaceae bacterium]
MDDRVKGIHWSFEADADLNEIYAYYLEQAPDNASQNLLELISETEKIVFTKQWQVDEFDSTCRRIIIKRKFRVVYKVIEDVILITAVYPTKKNPENFRKTEK